MMIRRRSSPGSSFQRSTELSFRQAQILPRPTRAVGMHSALPVTCLAMLLLSARTPQKSHAPHPQFDPPSIVSSAEAAYPLHSVAWGTVVLELSLDESGAITNIRVVRGIPSLTESAERSAREWKFQPAQFEGRPVPSKVPVAFSFVPPNVGPR